MTDHDDFHHYTRGRFVRNESSNMAKRYIAFDIHELQKVAAQAVKSESCVKFERLPEGQNGKAFLLTMSDGAQVVAKLPNLQAGRPHFTTASEVATMDYVSERLLTREPALTVQVRTELDIPVPKVYAWCSRAQDSPVKSEYIIMEKAKGVALQPVLGEMDLKQRWELIQTLTEYQLSCAEAPFEKCGSLYYENDLKPVPENSDASNYDTVRPSGFVVGPNTGTDWEGYDGLQEEFDRGPCKQIIQSDAMSVH